MENMYSWGSGRRHNSCTPHRLNVGPFTLLLPQFYDPLRLLCLLRQQPDPQNKCWESKIPANNNDVKLDIFFRLHFQYLSRDNTG